MASVDSLQKRIFRVKSVGEQHQISKSFHALHHCKQSRKCLTRWEKWRDCRDEVMGDERRSCGGWGDYGRSLSLDSVLVGFGRRSACIPHDLHWQSVRLHSLPNISWLSITKKQSTSKESSLPIEGDSRTTSAADCFAYDETHAPEEAPKGLLSHHGSTVLPPNATITSVVKSVSGATSVLPGWIPSVAEANFCTFLDL